MRQPARQIALLAACLFSLLAAPRPAAPQNATAPDPLPAEAIAGEVIVKFRPGMSDAQRDRLVDREGGSRVERLSPGADRVELPEGADPAETAEALEEQAGVEYAEPNYLVRVEAVDTMRSQQWALEILGVESAWRATSGRPEVLVAVIDTGVDLDHPDLVGRFVAGYDFASNDSDPSDDHGHGTLVAGVIAAAANNGTGIAGVAPGVKILPLKALSASGVGNDFDVARAIRHAADRGAKVINMSFGGPEASQTLQEAADYAFGKGVVLVGAAGNEGKGVLYYPGAAAHVMAAGAADRDDRRASFSNYGNGLSVVAPGVAVLSTSRGGNYDLVSGTSIAAPHVSGVAALILSYWPALPPDEVRARIERSAVDKGAPGYDAEYGWGRLDASQALGGAGWSGESGQAAAPQNQDVSQPASSGANPGQSAPVAGNNYVYPNPFSPNTDGYLDATAICYDLSEEARVSVVIYGATGVKRTLLRLAKRPAGANCLGWTGTDDRGAVLPDGNYRYQVTPSGSAGTGAPVSGVVALYRDAHPYGDDLPDISEAWFSPNPFLSRPQSSQSVATVGFAISRDACVTLKVFSARGEVKSLVSRQVKRAGAYYLGWTGADNAGKLLPPGNYRYVVYAANTRGTRTYTGLVGVR